MPEWELRYRSGHLDVVEDRLNLPSGGIASIDLGLFVDGVEVATVVGSVNQLQWGSLLQSHPNADNRAALVARASVLAFKRAVMDQGRLPPSASTTFVDCQNGDLSYRGGLMLPAPTEAIDPSFR